MSLISLEFAGFLLLLLLLYYIIPRKLQWGILLIGSLTFYILSSVPYTIVYLLLSMLTAYLAGMYMRKADAKLERPGVNHSAYAKKKKAVFLLAVTVNIGLLFALKYTNGFFTLTQRLLSLFGSTLDLGHVEWIASLGMSFYTLQIVGYIADTYWGISPAQKNPLKLLLFVNYFPQIGSGPIGRYNQLGGQLYTKHTFSYKNITYGMQRILWGVFKKLVLAERLAAVVRPIFGDPTVYNGSYVWIGAIAAVFQIYMDFSGNMDFVIGMSECFGIRLAENFQMPFFSRTIQEFWQRWHITLGAWLKDYLMFPLLRSHVWQKIVKVTKKTLGKKAAKLLPTFFAMLVLWIANGIWHGAEPKYLAVVLWFWFAVMMGQLLTPAFDKLNALFKINTDCFSWRLFQRIRTVFIYAIGVVFFCASGVSGALKMLKSSVTVFNPYVLFNDHLLQMFGGWLNLIVLVAGIWLVLKVESHQLSGHSARDWLARQNIVFRWILLFGLIFSIILFGYYGSGYNPADFIYAGF